MAESNGLGGIGAIGFDNMSDSEIFNNEFTCSRCPRPFIRAGNATGNSNNNEIHDNSFSGNNIAIDLRGTAKTTGININFRIHDNHYINDDSSLHVFTSNRDREISFDH